MHGTRRRSPSVERARCVPSRDLTRSLVSRTLVGVGRAWWTSAPRQDNWNLPRNYGAAFVSLTGRVPRFFVCLSSTLRLTDRSHRLGSNLTRRAGDLTRRVASHTLVGVGRAWRTIAPRQDNWTIPRIHGAASAPSGSGAALFRFPEP